MIKTSRAQLVELFTALGLCKGETVMIHSALFSLGLIEGDVNGFYEELRHVIGEEGTLIVPTFTYSFRRNELFDQKNTPSAKNIGLFSEFIRTHSDAVRSADPLFSMAAIGPEAPGLMERDSQFCFGDGSVYHKLFEKNIRFLAIGITYSSGLTGFMHLEKLAQVPYREDLPLSGITRNIVGDEYYDTAIHFTRLENVYGATITDREAMGLLLEQEGASTSLAYGYGRHLSLSGHHWRDVVLSELAKNPLIMLDHSQYTDKQDKEKSEFEE
ncbi:AAC(3) family N-acetyltransferase [Chlorobium phaeovibrioides]|uniref:AAC(3) family N-acetyltransferase n=1 Tax=Chlorobium phaeovibrioides TaxID=1094 RepID=UPI000F83997A|nr:AAC(3) family N-acetyltransferase [Chlorobium phaeovibrioides]RTY33468.1 AAC(3) family N-acetyltransferase [Chlorobium phaeovibrioides]